MIETLRGLEETVHFKHDSKFILYANENYESYPQHWHVALEIIMPLKNDYFVTCEDTLFELKEGDFLLIAPGTLHSMSASYGKRLIFQVDFSLFHELADLELLFEQLPSAILITPTQSIYKKIQCLMHQISEEYFGHIPLTEALIYSKLLEILVLLGRNFSVTQCPPSPKSSKHKSYTTRFLPIWDYINEHYMENLTLEQMAQLTGFSKYHFSRLFKQFTHISFYKYLTKKRIENAEKLLLDDGLTITEVALNSGFSSISAFIRMFKIMKGCTPTEYKNLNL